MQGVAAGEEIFSAPAPTPRGSCKSQLLPKKDCHFRGSGNPAPATAGMAHRRPCAPFDVGRRERTPRAAAQECCEGTPEPRPLGWPGGELYDPAPDYERASRRHHRTRGPQRPHHRRCPGCHITVPWHRPISRENNDTRLVFRKIR